MSSKKKEVVDLTLDSDDVIYSIASACPFEPTKRCATPIDLTINANDLQPR